MNIDEPPIWDLAKAAAAAGMNEFVIDDGWPDSTGIGALQDNFEAMIRVIDNREGNSDSGLPSIRGGEVQDAYVAAVAAHLAHRLRLRAPAWTDKKSRRLEHSWFALPDAWARATLLRDSPAAFRERNLFATEDALNRA